MNKKGFFKGKKNVIILLFFFFPLGMLAFHQQKLTMFIACKTKSYSNFVFKSKKYELFERLCKKEGKKRDKQEN